MGDPTNHIYEFGEFRLDRREQKLTREGQPVSVTPKVFDLLVILVENAGRLMEKDELLKRLWQDSFVEEANLNVNISSLRRALGERSSDHRFIETVPRRGYRFVADVRAIVAEAEMDRTTSDLHASDGETLLLGTPASRCSSCGKVYHVRDLKFCRVDGAALAPVDEQTAAVSGPRGIATMRSRRWLIYGGGAVVVALSIFFVWRFWFKPKPATVTSVRTIAILPFKPLTNDQRDPALQLGMADALITKLSNLQQITVRPTSAIAKYLDTNPDPLAAGRELQVEAILDGKIQRADNRIRVTVQLLRVSDGATLWAGSFDDFFTNIFAVQDSISDKMNASLRLKMSGREQQLAAKRYTEDTEAYDLYLQGNVYQNKGIPDDIRRSVPYYQKAVERDPSYVLPYVALTLAYVTLSDFNVDRQQSAELARQSAAKSVSLDPELAEANLALGAVKYNLDLNVREADEYLRRAIQANPSNSEALLRHAYCLENLGQFDEALAVLERARQIDPLSVWINTARIDLTVDARRYDEAQTIAEALVAANPRSVHYRRSLARVLAAKGQYAQAIAQHQEEVELGGMPRSSAALGYIFARAGQTDKARQILKERIPHVGEPSISNYGIALIYLGLGEINNALSWLEKSYQAREPLILLVKPIPEWDPVRADPKYRDLINRLGLGT